jgi:signal transduction histidine kinase
MNDADLAGTSTATTPASTEWPGRGWFVILGAYLAVYISWQIWRWIPIDETTVGQVILKPIDIAAAWVAWQASRSSQASPRVALAWRLIAWGLLGQLAGGLAGTAYELLGRSPYPSLADPLYLSFYPLMLAALLVLPATRLTRSQRLRLVLDLATTALGAAVVVWYVLIAPTARAGDQSAVQMAFSLAYPVGDTILIVGVASLLLRGVAKSMRRALWLVTAGLCLFVVGDVVWAYVTLHGVFDNGDALNITYAVALALFIVAARCKGPIEAAEPELVRSQRVSWMPYLAVAAGFAVLLTSEVREGVSWPLILTVAATALAVLVTVRQLVAQRELVAVQHELLSAHDDLAVAYEAEKRAFAERERMEIELRLAQKLEAVGQLAAGIAHEINTPIQFVGDTTRFLSNAFADLIPLQERYAELVTAAHAGPVPAELLERVAAAEELAEVDYLLERVPAACERTFEGIGHVAKIVGAMRTFAHPTSDKVAVDINEAVRNTLIVTANEYKYVAELRTDLAEIEPVICSASDLNQVLINLVVNAAHAVVDQIGDSGERGLIEVKTRREPGGVLISIADTGCGIAPEAADRIFDPFFTTKEVGRGTGQGLAIARAIIAERHGGTITFTTEPGHGTTFEVRLPTSSPSAPRPARIALAA